MFINFILTVLLIVVIFQYATKYCIGISGRQCSTQFFTTIVQVGKYLGALFYKIWVSVSRAVAETPMPKFAPIGSSTATAGASGAAGAPLAKNEGYEGEESADIKRALTDLKKEDRELFEARRELEKELKKLQEQFSML
jgi:hypothetical protein